jgi:hypothetical protein
MAIDLQILGEMEPEKVRFSVCIIRTPSRRALLSFQLSS